MAKFIHSADIHLDSPLAGLERYEGAPVDQIRLASREAFTNLVNLAIEEKVDFIIIAGDLFDGDWKDYNTGLYFSKQMSRLKEKQISVFLLKGNHDAANKITKSLRLPDNVSVFDHLKPQTFELPALNIALHGQSFANQSITNNLSLKYPEAVPGMFNIGVLHTCATSTEHERYAPCSIDDLKTKGYQYWALGHVHKRQILSKNPYIVFPGNIQGRHIKESGQKGCELVTINNDDKIDSQFCQLNVMQWQTLELNCEALISFESVLEEFSKQIVSIQSSSNVMTALRIIFKGSSVADEELRFDSEYVRAQIRAKALEIAGESIWIEKIKVDTTTVVEPLLANFAEGPMSEISLLVEQLEGEDAAQTVKYWLSDLDKKLPFEVRKSISWDDKDFLSSAIKDAHAILTKKLSGRESQ